MSELSEEKSRQLDAMLQKIVGRWSFTKNDIQGAVNSEELFQWLIDTNRASPVPGQKGFYTTTASPNFLAMYYQPKIKELWESNSSIKHPQDIRYLYWAINRTSFNVGLIIKHELKQPENLDLNNTKEAVERQLLSLSKGAFLSDAYWVKPEGNYMITERGIYRLKEYFEALKAKEEQSKILAQKKIDEKSKQDKIDKREDGKFKWQKVHTVVAIISILVTVFFALVAKDIIVLKDKNKVNNDNANTKSDTAPNDTLSKRRNFTP